MIGIAFGSPVVPLVNSTSASSVVVLDGLGVLGVAVDEVGEPSTTPSTARSSAAR